MPKTRPAKSRSYPQLGAAQPVAPDDLRPGDTVVVADTDSAQVPPLDTAAFRPGAALPAVRVTYIPHDAGTPRRVLAVHLPFVYVREPDGYAETLDLRTTRLLRLDRKAGRRLFVQMHPAFARDSVNKAARRAAKRLRKRDRKNA